MCNERRNDGTKLPINESTFIARSQISMIIFKQRKHMYFRQNADNLRLVRRLEFSQPFLSLKQFKISSKGAIRKLMFPVFVPAKQIYYCRART